MTAPNRELRATVKCAGEIDTTLASKYGSGPKTLEVSPSPVFEGGYEYTLNPGQMIIDVS